MANDFENRDGESSKQFNHSREFIDQAQKTLTEQKEIIIQLIDRVDRKLDDLGRQSPNGHS